MFLLINKPAGITSHDVILGLRKITGEKTIGHAGTLDPFATGLLIVAVGRESTSWLQKFLKLDKEYTATLRLGTATDTHDKTGKLLPAKLSTPSSQLPALNKKQIKNVLKNFTGKQLQTPPMYSAKKVAGQKLYQLARQGQTVERVPQRITIYQIKLLSYHYPELKIRVACSSGTYLRTLAHDIGQQLGCGAYLEELQRTKIGKYKLRQAVTLDKLTVNNWQKFGVKMGVTN
ncbi:tRNA pseudouridine(55) synthase TruB [Candidatus Falkowbacteria bacterium]|nr:tRNA pseudouridine(55) synthase TruB [Candidatus Falkowbacteria bacterium]